VTVGLENGFSFFFDFSKIFGGDPEFGMGGPAAAIKDIGAGNGIGGSVGKHDLSIDLEVVFYCVFSD
jgi:hypothetical protein